MAQNDTTASQNAVPQLDAQAKIDAVLSFLADIPVAREYGDANDENDANWEEAQIQLANDVRAILKGAIQTF